MVNTVGMLDLVCCVISLLFDFLLGAGLMSFSRALSFLRNTPGGELQTGPKLKPARKDLFSKMPPGGGGYFSKGSSLRFSFFKIQNMK